MRRDACININVQDDLKVPIVNLSSELKKLIFFKLCRILNKILSKTELDRDNEFWI